MIRNLETVYPAPTGFTNKKRNGKKKVGTKKQEMNQRIGGGVACPFLSLSTFSLPI